MKRIIITVIGLVLFVLSYSQLSSNAQYIRENFPTEYAQAIRHYAVQEWDTDHEMIVYEINNQAKALFNLIDEFESDNTNIAYNAIIEWSHKGYESKNKQLFQKLKTFDLKSLIKLYCDWEMVKYEYDNQVKAKIAY